MTRARSRMARDTGVMSVSVSVDGARATHDVLRGVEGSHAAALAAMHHLAEEGVQVSANTQINRLNRRELSDIFDEVKSAGAHSWQVQLTVAAGGSATLPLFCSSRTT